MKKTIIALVLILAAGGAAAYYFLAGPAAGSANANYAAIVPADTLFYAGSSGGNEFAEAMAAFRTANAGSLQANMDDYRKIAPKFGQAGLFLAGVLEAYVAQMEQGKPVPGVEETPRMAVYTVGIVPVLRVHLADATAFKQFLDDAEQRGGAQATTGSYQGVDYREYALKLDEKATRTALLVAVRPNYAVMTLDAPALRDETLPLALGLESPAQSLAQTGMLEQIAEKNGFLSGYVSFINHQAIVAALTGAPESRGGKMLTRLDTKHGLASLRAPACRQDLQSIAKVWPITVMGLLPDEASAAGVAEVHERMVSRLTDPSLTSTLGKLRGHIPAGLLNGSREPILAVALGLDASNIGTVASELQQRFVQADFQCDWLVKAQQQVRQKNPAAATIAAALISGVRGVSLSVFGVNPAPGAAAPDIDGLFNISANNPRMLFQMMQRMQPNMFGNVQLPADGESVVLPLREGAPQVRVMVNGQHLLLFSGEQASKVAGMLAKDELKPNGALFYRIDYGELMPVLAKFFSRHKGTKEGDAAKMQAVAESLQRMGQSKLRVRALLDLQKHGVVLEVNAAADKAQAGS